MTDLYEHEDQWKVSPSACFYKWNGDWYIVALADEDLRVGDRLKVERRSGGHAYVILTENVPYVVKNDKQRWLFRSRTKDNRPYGLAERFGESNVRQDIAEDGKPRPWSRDENGKVHWPHPGEVWRKRGTDRLGVIKRGSNPKQAGWYEVNGEKGQWMYIPIIMDDFEFVARSEGDLNVDDE